MSLNNTFMMSEDIYTPGPLFINALVKNGEIKKSEFSFYFQPFGLGASHVDVGPPQVENVKGGSLKNMITIPMNKDFFWSSFFQGIAFGDTSEANSYTFEGGYPYTILDTGSSHLFVPDTYLEVIV